MIYGTKAVLYLSSILADGVVPNPSPSAPGVGANSIGTLIGIAKWGALICCGIAMVVSGGMIALGNLSQRPHMTERGKTTMVYSSIGAIVVAAGIPFINWMFSNSGS